MANSLTQLNTLTGCFPGATGLPADGASTLPASITTPYNNTAGYIAIPLNSIAYTGGEPNRFIVDNDGVNPALTIGVGDGAGTCTGRLPDICPRHGMNLGLVIPLIVSPEITPSPNGAKRPATM